MEVIILLTSKELFVLKTRLGDVSIVKAIKAEVAVKKHLGKYVTIDEIVSHLPCDKCDNFISLTNREVML